MFPMMKRDAVGKLIRDKGYVSGLPVISRYCFGEDGILTINTDYNDNQGQERCWFLTDDFRVRVSTIQMLNGVSLMAYCFRTSLRLSRRH